ncbi:testis-expressed protein 10 homolog [Culicoides brevitarsis]|uniref:testis-expressed protein 10 homolog n=1 Tax=Culicoides brevitarsis TaxID=469753 RepID=UPI00307B2358
MTRHRKFLKAEKARTKLKGAQLPKGLNVTKTEFKVRKIVIPEQLKDKSSLNQALSRKLLSVKECVARLGHNNPQHRAEGLRNLKDIIDTNAQEILDQHFSTVLKGIAEMSVDIERENRREACRILSLLLIEAVKVRPDGSNIEPFFNILCSYLRCAMTHITQAIQEDSLLLLDVLMTYVPRLVAANRDKILPSYMDMISKSRTEGKPERTLTVHLGSKITGVKWRIKVLERLCALLVAVNSEKRRAMKKNVVEYKADAEVNVFEMDFDETPQVPVNYYDPEKNFTFPLIASHLEELPDFSNIGDENAKTNDEGTIIKSYVELTMPLMFETWLEVRPSSDNIDSNGTSITTDAAYTLKLLLQVILQLQSLVELWCEEASNDELSLWFKEKFSNDFQQHFLIAGFPFNQIHHAENKKRNSKGGDRDLAKAGGVKCFIQNLMICNIYCRVAYSQENFSQSVCSKVVNYLKQVVRVWETIPIEAGQYLNAVLRSVFLIAKLPGVKDLLKSLIASYLNEENTRKENKTKISILLCNILLNNELMKKFGVDLFQQWIQVLPEQLLEESVSQRVLDVFTHLCRQLNRHFLSSLEQKLEDIVRNLPKIKVVGAADELEGQKSIASLVYWIKNEEKLRSVQKIANSELKDSPYIVGFLNEIIEIRLKTLKNK